MNELPRWLKPVTIWLLLGLALLMGIQAWEARQAATRFVADGGSVQLRRGADGHYRWPGRINGRTVEFLVDTGATGTAIPAVLARELQLQTTGAMQSNTAGGTVSGSFVVGDVQLDGGVHAERMRMAALPNLASPLLGMDVLGRLRLQQEDGVLRIDLRDSGH
jgi:aspartyl protease family protein